MQSSRRRKKMVFLSLFFGKVNGHSAPCLSGRPMLRCIFLRLIEAMNWDGVSKLNNGKIWAALNRLLGSFEWKILSSLFARANLPLLSARRGAASHDADFVIMLAHSTAVQRIGALWCNSHFSSLFMTNAIYFPRNIVVALRAFFLYFFFHPTSGVSLCQLWSLRKLWAGIEFFVSREALFFFHWNKLFKYSYAR